MVTTTVNYDTHGNPIELIDAKGTKTRLRYEESRCPGQLTSVTSAVSLPQENTAVFAYDTASCNVIETIDPLGYSTLLEYDAAGNVIRSTDAEGRVTRFQYDMRNRLTKVLDATTMAADPPCGTAGVTCYQYDAIGNLIQVTDARGHVTQFVYDTLDRLIASLDPVGNVESFTYDANGNLASTMDRQGQIITFAYDGVNQLVRKVLPGNLETRFTYDVAGNLEIVQSPSSEVAMVYDPLGRLLSAQTLIFDAVPTGPPVTITQPTTIGPNNTQFDGTALTIVGTQVVIDGPHTFSSLTLKNGAVVSHSAATLTSTSSLDLTIDGLLAIDATSRIDVSAKGYVGA